MFPLSQHRRWRSPKRSSPVDETRSVQTRFTILRLTVLAVFVVLSLQLARLQLLHGSTYRHRAETQRLWLVPVSPPRGLIYDRNGTLLVENVPTYTIVAVPANLPRNELEQNEVYRRLEVLLQQSAQELRLKIEDRRKTQNASLPMVLKQNLTPEEAFQFLEQRAALPGIELVIEPSRRYTEGPLFAHVLGFVGGISSEEYATLKGRGYQINDRIGKTGVELTYEATLRGVPGRRFVEKDAFGREIFVVGEEPPQPGHNLILAIDADLQRKAGEFLAAGMGRSRNAAALVMDVRSGELLAMVSLPSFDNNLFSGPILSEQVQRLLDDPARPLVNHAISEMYPPGSIFKQITGVAALQEKVATPRTTITSRGYIYVRNQFVPGKDFLFPDWAPLGALDFYGGIAMSSNVYFYCVTGGCGPDNGQPEYVKGMGPTALARYARAFGLGAETGVDLPGEAAGIIPDPEWKKTAKPDEDWYDGDTYFMAIGEGDVTATPLQMLVATAAIANGGDVLVPRVVREVRGEDGNTVLPFQRTVRRHLPVDPENLAVMRNAMRQAAVWGTAKPASVGAVPVAGKTGTAEFGVQIGDRKYATHGWFAGFAPADDPQIAVIVFLERGVGQQDAAPIAGRIFQYYFQRTAPGRVAVGR